MMTDHLNEADEHERSERTSCRVTARKMPRIKRPSGHTIACGGSWLAGRATNAARCDTHRNQGPSGRFFCSSLFIWYVALLVPDCGGEDDGCGAGYRLIGLGRRTLFYVYGFLCLSRGPVLVAYFRGFSSLASVFRFFGVGDLFRTGALFAIFAPVLGRLLGPRIFLHLTRTRNFSSSRQP